MGENGLKNEVIKNIRQGVETAYIDGSLASNFAYQPGFVSNNSKEGKKVISAIKDKMQRSVDMENSKTSGNFRVARLNREKHRRKH